ncbi:MAG: NFACT family protein [Epsilonproteobacteria bacterium]|nr:NFACT family protein [Campylobacterota bacterium]
MKRFELLQIATHLQKYKKINAIEKVDDTIIKIAFDRDEPYFFDMKRGDSHIFKKPSYQKVRHYNAPFDVVLTKRFINACIEQIEVLEGNRILSIEVATSSKYKAERSILQFEFTGRNTNVIILDDCGVIVEAFRHIDARTSFREVKVGVMLLPLPPREFNETQTFITDVELYLNEAYSKRERAKLSVIKNQKVLTIAKKMKKLQISLDRLEDEIVLVEKSSALQMNGNLILSNIHNMKNYQKEIEVYDYEGTLKTIQLPEDVRTPAEAANRLFSRAKKLKQKAKYNHIERENLEAKIIFLQRLKESVLAAKEMDEVNLYLPKQPKKIQKRTQEDSNVESFYIEGYKISLGKNEKGNITLLKKAKMSDIWMHLKDMPSTHVIIRNDKKTVPEPVLAFGAKLCVQFSAVEAGSYLVDYTYRRNVKMRDGANVNYVEYKTVKAMKT